MCGGDLNIDLKLFKEREFLEFMKESFNHDINIDSIIPLRSNGITIDAVFSQHVENLTIR